MTFWLGTVVLSVLFGNVFRAFNPWRAIAHAVAAAFSALVGQKQTAPLRYPERLGRWPAVAGLRRLRLPRARLGADRLRRLRRHPADASRRRRVAYSLYTFVAMGLFGIERWTDRGETFTQYFGMFAQPRGLRGPRRAPRPAAACSPARRPGPLPAGSLALVLTAIGATTFDGAQEGVLKDAISSTFQIVLRRRASRRSTALRLTNTLYLAGTLARRRGDLLGRHLRHADRRRQALGARARRGSSRTRSSRSRSPTSSPTTSASSSTRSRPSSRSCSPTRFGDGSNWFGTAGSGIDYGLVGATAIWYVQFGAIVVGHVIALALGHDRALSLWKDPRTAAYSQVWMLVTMVFFSVLGLYLLSQANG